MDTEKYIFKFIHTLVLARIMVLRSSKPMLKYKLKRDR